MRRSVYRPARRAARIPFGLVSTHFDPIFASQAAVRGLTGPSGRDSEAAAGGGALASYLANQVDWVDELHASGPSQGHRDQSPS